MEAGTCGDCDATLTAAGTLQTDMTWYTRACSRVISCSGERAQIELGLSLGGLGIKEGESEQRMRRPVLGWGVALRRWSSGHEADRLIIQSGYSQQTCYSARKKMRSPTREKVTIRKLDLSLENT